jgi:hypothetical protein
MKRIVLVLSLLVFVVSPLVLPHLNPSIPPPSFQHSILVLQDLKITPNTKVLKLNYQTHNDGFRSFSMNMTFDTLFVITKLWMFVTVKSPQDINDKNYQKEVLKTVVDVEKSLSGVRNNILVSTIVNSFLKSCDQELKFPLKKVKLHEIRRKQPVNSVFQGTYQFTNLTFSDDFFPIPYNFNFYVELKTVVRIQGANKNTQACTSWHVIEFKSNQGLIQGATDFEEVLKKLRV